MMTGRVETLLSLSATKRFLKTVVARAPHCPDIVEPLLRFLELFSIQRVVSYGKERGGVPKQMDEQFRMLRL